MRTSCLVLLIALTLSASRAEEVSPRKKIAAAVKRIDLVLADWKKAGSREEAPPGEELLEAMRGLGGLPYRDALTKLAGYLGHRDDRVARCAVQGLLVPENEALRLVSGSLLAKRLSPKLYQEKRRELFIDQVYALAATGYLGAFDHLKAMLRKVQDGEVVALAAETLAHLKDHRAIHVLEDWASWDRGYRDEAGTVADTGRRRDTAVGARPRDPQIHGKPPPGTNRRNSAGGAFPKPGEKWVRDAVYDAFFVLIGREGRGFDSYEEYTKYMVEHRAKFKEKAAKAAARAKEQDRKIRSCP